MAFLIADFIPPKPWHDSLVRSALFVAERKFTSSEPEDPSQDDELLAHRARVFVEAINRMPVEQQPANWVVADDPNAKAEWLNDKLNFMAGFNRELSKENEQLRARIDHLQHYAAMTPLGHFQRWTDAAGWHEFTEPSPELIAERMRAKYADRTTTPPNANPQETP